MYTIAATDRPSVPAASSVAARAEGFTLAFHRERTARDAAEELARQLVTGRIRAARSHIERESLRIMRQAAHEGWSASKRTRRIRAMTARTCRALAMQPASLRDTLRYSAGRYPGAGVTRVRWEQLIRRGHLSHVTVELPKPETIEAPLIAWHTHPLAPRAGTLCELLRRIYMRDWREYNEAWDAYGVACARADDGDDVAERALTRLTGKLQQAMDTMHQSSALHSRAFALAMRLARAECAPRLGALPLP